MAWVYLRAYEVPLPNISVGPRRQRIREQMEEAWSRYVGRQRASDVAAFRHGEDSGLMSLCVS